MAGTLTISTLSDGTNSTSSTNCIQGSAKAWVNFNGTTSPGTIRAQYNVSSVTKRGTGQYTLNFTNALADANYCPTLAGLIDGTSIGAIVGNVNDAAFANTASACYIRVGATTSTGNDAQVCCVAVFR